MNLSQKQLSALEAVLRDKPGLLSEIKVYNALGNEAKLKSACLEAAKHLHTQLKSLEPVSIPEKIVQMITNRKQGYKPDFSPNPDSEPRQFNWGIFHKGKQQ